ncbi:hypothetical protein FJZ17_04640 [Candidatus Pacearchaeota archaeon]|nr:hypothetical protein [Candidatus Pacearchaeota archaeon]
MNKTLQTLALIVSLALPGCSQLNQRTEAVKKEAKDLVSNAPIVSVYLEPGLTTRMDRQTIYSRLFGEEMQGTEYGSDFTGYVWDYFKAAMDSLNGTTGPITRMPDANRDGVGGA